MGGIYTPCVSGAIIHEEWKKGGMFNFSDGAMLCNLEKSLWQKLGPSGRINWCKVELIAGWQQPVHQPACSAATHQNIRPLAPKYRLGITSLHDRSNLRGPLCRRPDNSTRACRKERSVVSKRKKTTTLPWWLTGRRSLASPLLVWQMLLANRWWNSVKTEYNKGLRVHCAICRFSIFCIGKSYWSNIIIEVSDISHLGFPPLL